MAADAPRRSYLRGRLVAAEFKVDPLCQLQTWLRDAVHAGMLEPNAMALATADARGRVSVRMVLLKGIAQGALEFYSNYASRKAHDLADNPVAAATFWWDRLERQVRLEGAVEKLPAETSRAYFASRPYGSQLAAWASSQSRPVASREELERRFEAVKARFPEGAVPLPPAWGGYRLRPSSVEFWQGRENRLHDRLLYRAVPGGWEIQRLCP